LFCWGPVRIADTVFGETYYSIMSSYLKQYSSTVHLEGCSFSRWNLDSIAKMSLLDCHFHKFDLGVRLGFDSMFDQDRSLTVERCRFSDSIAWGSYDGYGILLMGPGVSQYDCTVSIRNCTFYEVKRAIWADTFDSRGGLLIDNNTITGAFVGIDLIRAGRVCRVGNDTIHASTGILMRGLGGLVPSISNETIVASFRGISLQLDEVRAQFELWDLNISSIDTGIYGEGVNLTVSNSTIRSLRADLVLNHGLIHLEGCSHMYGGEAYNGMILDHRTVDVTAVGWDNGETIDHGRTRLYPWNPEVGRFVDHAVELDNSDLGPVTLLHWYVNSTLNAVFDNVEPCYISSRVGEDPEYRAPMYSIRNTPSVAIQFTDVDFRMDLRSPLSGTTLGGRHVEIVGSYTERGMGMEAIVARCDEGSWVNGTFDGKGEWSVIVPVPQDGVHNLTANGWDRAGNEWTVVAGWVYVDGTPPPLELLGPGLTTNQAHPLLVGQTEANATVLVDLHPVKVGRDGRFQAPLDLVEGITIVTVFLEDPLGNNRTVTYSIELDTIPPLLVVDLPGNQGWVASNAVNVTGVTEADATVRVDGRDVVRDGASFHLELHLSEGTYQMEVVAVDPAGNQRMETVIAKVDLTPPDLIIDSPQDGLVQADGRVLIRGAIDDTDPLRLTVDGNEVETTGGTWEHSVALQEGRNDIRVLAIDQAGNTVSLTISVRRDSQPPVFEAILHLGRTRVTKWSGPSRTSSTQAELEVSTDEPCFIEVRGVGRTALPMDNWSLDIPLVADEWYALVVNVTDVAGNHAEEVRFEVVCDIRPPYLTISSPMNGYRTERRLVTVSGQTEPGANLTIDGVPVALNATYGFNVEVELQWGTNLIEIVSRDAVGNEAKWTLAVLRLEEDGDASGGTILPLAGSLVVNLVLLGAVAFLLWRSRKMDR
jgi:hypothetical protein